ncbi:MAG: DUF6455 family protein [Paracoccaceae bacterium]
MSGFSRKLMEFLSTERTGAEINAMSDREIAEIGLDRVELRGIAAMRPQMRTQMLRMAERFGLDEGDITRPRWRALECVHACRTCSQSEACHRFLTGLEDGAFGYDDCPNAPRYSEIAAERA